MPAACSRPYTIRDPAAIRLLASPLRQAILDVVGARGPITVAALSERLGRPADRLYYHIRLLARAGLLIAVRAATGAGKSGATYDVPGRPMRLEYDLETASTGRALARVMNGLLRSTRTDLTRAFSEQGVRVAGPHRELWAGRVEALLTMEDIAKVNVALAELLALIELARTDSHANTDEKYFQFTWALSPTSTRS